MENMGQIANRGILIIGNLGYIGPVAARYFRQKYPGITLRGYDIGYFMQQYTTDELVGETCLDSQYFGDVRNFKEYALEGMDAVIYLAAISNDPMGNAFEQPTFDINYHAAIDIARKAKTKGVKNFVFASSCSVYGLADTASRTEMSEVNPLTTYARSKVYAERGLETLAGNDFKITCLRYATACGFSDRIRLDLVLNDFVASAIAGKKITILSDGTPWRPLIHVKDMSRAMDWAIHRNTGTPFLIINTGSNNWNYQVKELASAVQSIFSDVEVSINPHAQPDKRSYKVSFDLYEKLAPNHQPTIDLNAAVKDLKGGLQKIKFNDISFRSSNLIRLKTLQGLINNNIIDKNLFIRTS